MSTTLRKASPGTSYPPTDIADIAAYDHDEVLAGYLEYETDDPIPGPNHPPGYRWGATNRARDKQHADDGFDDLRHAYIKARRQLQ